jgi:hypothetical protein
MNRITPKVPRSANLLEQPTGTFNESDSLHAAEI